MIVEETATRITITTKTMATATTLHMQPHPQRQLRGQPPLLQPTTLLSTLNTMRINPVETLTQRMEDTKLMFRCTINTTSSKVVNRLQILNKVRRLLHLQVAIWVPRLLLQEVEVVVGTTPYLRRLVCEVNYEDRNNWGSVLNAKTQHGQDVLRQIAS